MQFKIFTIPVADDGAALEDMNRFLRGHKVLEVEQQLLSTKTGSNWHFCVKYLANAQPEGSRDGGRPVSAQSKVDYREVLSEKTFAVFSVLRECRKKIAEEDGLPVYAVFTNEELANIASLEEITADRLKQVKGVGDKKAERFGVRLVETWRAASLQDSGTGQNQETGRAASLQTKTP
ncbi:MAG: HRDC domain-containing protein [Bacteroidales bacterium]|jgi:superfamily II DNA helicase RecQ|nr:HRDC domain-containing protein [Bacteroidales bacterium]